MLRLADNIKSKRNWLCDEISKMKRLAVAFSGGVDSTLLLKIAYDVLKENMVGIYADSPLQASRERRDALKLAKQIGAELIVFNINKLDDDAFRKNQENRCYLCKGMIFDEILAIAHAHEIKIVADGSNYDDLADFRPGARALKERGIRSPLQEASLTKEEIRALSRNYGLSTSDKDALACLATRIPFGEEVNLLKLGMIDRAEEVLTDRGFRNVRARHFGNTVKLEVRADQVILLSKQPLLGEIEKEMRILGFTNVIVDPAGYSQGKLNKSPT